MPQTGKSKAKLKDLANSIGTETFVDKIESAYDQSRLAELNRLRRINARRELVAEIAITIVGLLAIAGICTLMIKSL